MTQWGVDTIFNPAKRHMDEEKRRLQSTRQEVGDNSGGRRIDLESGKVTIPRRPADDPDATEPADAHDAQERAGAEVGAEEPAVEQSGKQPESGAGAGGNPTQATAGESA